MLTNDEKAGVLHREVSDIGGTSGPPVDLFERELEPWEKRCHATLECLAWRGVMSTETKRRGAEDMGRAIYADLTYYEKWIMSATNHLLEHGFVTQDQIAAKTEEVRRRLEVNL
jgi:hypothetical protein